MTLNRFSDRPLYRQLIEQLEHRLSERLSPGDRLPSEAELADEYEVNRLTVRQALADLTRRGMVTTLHGKGSYVAAPAVRYEVHTGSDASFSRAMQARGHNVRLRRLRVTDDDSETVLSQLGIGGTARRFELLRLLDGTPWSLSTTWLPVAERFADLEERWDGETSLYGVLEEHYGIRMVRANRSFTSVPADPVDAEHLAIPVGAPVLVMSGLNVSGEGEPVAVVEHRFRGDRVQFTVDMT